MSVFSFLGKAVKGLGKGVLAVGKVGVNVAGNVIGVGNIIPNNNGGAQQATVASINPYVVDGRSQQIGGGSLLDLTKDALAGVGNFLNGRTHAQVDANVGAGGRVGDPLSGGMPSWLLPVGLIGGALLLIKTMSGGGRRRY